MSLSEADDLVFNLIVSYKPHYGILWMKCCHFMPTYTPGFVKDPFTLSYMGNKKFRTLNIELCLVRFLSELSEFLHLFILPVLNLDMTSVC